ncbi:GNAT family acetyltransferase [Gordonia spumicola]|uniref:GNAT family acetyltransferase n=1 Tax=Gordonia spumicola TaxID=589161 RepID=A0A7I9V5K1_9ACTN|nr:GNAT family N-acetyltransferase [Gordonia spumicola]GEE00695.1 GNAT family acetyltransferase [Gordonia spumicola]
MTVVVRAAHDFEAVRTMIGPKRPDASVCFCLSHRLPAKQNRSLVGPARGDYVRGLCESEIAPGVLAFDGDEVVGWAGVAPRSETSFARSTKIPHLDDLPVWSVWCLRVRPGHRGKGITASLLDGAVDFARSHGAPVLEGYPSDNGDDRIDLTMAFVGSRAMFEKAGFSYAGATSSLSGGFPRVIMRHDLH